MQPNQNAVERPLKLVEKLAKKKASLEHTVMPSKYWIGFGIDTAIDIVKQHSDWIDISVEPNNRTEFDSEVVLAIDVNGYTYNVTLANVSIGNKAKREWTECKAKWNGEFWEAVEYICQSEKLVAYRYIPQPPSEVQSDKHTH